ncbi:hypothetical protein DBV23_03560 [Edwardsiella ictaluri]|uniref:Uncharacterized protein n=3 Tax=Edwardsiella ictaluri TaxID=67780 RepID=C5B9R4_EDWI9|nr:hypothetical protein [Edwardsiella ictaluri]ACR68166.1 hypothetical protein NT01EI_0953 [Edwardsiella ictaluri 93-146]AVZ81446.1 hypothetical protein DBV23_03560 [Edwardsiella ictaluri]EKS7764270.1 hypothetical protein [Edwardsiella ictaluri]EKS7771128.1 hypothetical protein [Edwardsiella ictaluri]EKS7777554.1 hypothetical protein [Edwardsiella ictaluri]
MSQHVTNPLLQIMQDLQQRQRKLGKQIDAFHTLQQEIATLHERAPHDPLARQRLERFSRAMREEIAPLRQQLNDCISRLQTHFTALNATLKQGNRPAPSHPDGTGRSPAIGHDFI